MNTEEFHTTVAEDENFVSDVKRTLLYYEVFHYPLTPMQLFTFLPSNSLTFNEFYSKIKKEVFSAEIKEKKGFICIGDESETEMRLKHEHNAASLLRIAKAVTHIIKRFPFVRGIFLSGELSKLVSAKDGDIDFMIVTAPNRLWICRTLLIIFKKIFLINNKKYFCLNYFVAENNLLLQEHNIYTATEVAHLKPMYNSELFKEYMRVNNWIQNFFPNFSLARMNILKTNNRRSTLQKIIETLFPHNFALQLDRWLMKRTENIWKSRYPEYDAETRDRIFKCQPDESRTFVRHFEKIFFERYNAALKKFHISVPSLPQHS